MISHIETIIGSKTLTPATFTELDEFDGSSKRTRKFTIGRARAISLFASLGDLSADSVELRLSSHNTRNELFGLEYQIHSPSVFIDYFKDDSYLLTSDERLLVSAKSPNADFLQTYLTVFYDKPEKEVLGQFISLSELLKVRRQKVTKLLSFSMNTNGAPSWKSFASQIGQYNKSSRYALLGATSKSYEFDGGGQLNPYIFVMSGRATGGTLLAFPANVQQMGFDYTANYFARVSEDFGDIRSIPVLDGPTMETTFFDVWGDADGAQTFKGTLHLVQIQ